MEWGKLKDRCLVCPQSGSAFDLETGKRSKKRDMAVSDLSLILRLQAYPHTHTGELVGPWCPFPPVLGTFQPGPSQAQAPSSNTYYTCTRVHIGPLIMAKIYPARNLATFPVRAKGNNIEVRGVGL